MQVTPGLLLRKSVGLACTSRLKMHMLLPWRSILWQASMDWKDKRESPNLTALQKTSSHRMGGVASLLGRARQRRRFSFLPFAYSLCMRRRGIVSQLHHSLSCRTHSKTRLVRITRKEASCQPSPAGTHLRRKAGGKARRQRKKDRSGPERSPTLIKDFCKPTLVRWYCSAEIVEKLQTEGGGDALWGKTRHCELVGEFEGDREGAAKLP